MSHHSVAEDRLIRLESMLEFPMQSQASAESDNDLMCLKPLITLNGARSNESVIQLLILL